MREREKNHINKERVAHEVLLKGIMKNVNEDAMWRNKNRRRRPLVSFLAA